MPRLRRSERTKKRQISSDRDESRSSLAGLSKRKRQKTQETTDDSYDERPRIRIGPEYQAVIPDLILPVPSAPARDDEPEDDSTLMWAPTESISDKQLDEYILLASKKYGCDREQALNVLYLNHYDLEKAIADLPEHVPKSTDDDDHWTPKDNQMFDIAFKLFKKKFFNQKNVMLHKSRKSLVRHYYLWKHRKHTDNGIDLQVQEEPRSAESHDKMSDKQTASVAKYYYLWKNKTQKGKNSCGIGQQNLGFNSIGS